MIDQVVIAYDGSAAADVMLHQLDLAGLREEVDARLLVAPELFSKEKLGAPSDPILRMKFYAAEGLALLRRLRPNWSVQIEVRNEPPIWAILDAIESKPTKMVVMAAHGKGGGDRVLLGSVSHKVLLSASCSVLVSRPIKEYPARALRILAPLDGSASSQLTIDMLSSASWPNNTEVTLVTALDSVWLSELEDLAAGTPPLDSKAEEAIAQKMLDGYATKLSAKYKLSTKVLRGPAKHVILDLAEEAGCDLIVIGARGKSPIERLLLGSVSSAVSLHAGCSVLVIR